MLSTLKLLWTFLCCLFAGRSRTYRSDVYPVSIPKYNIRIDVYTNRPVVSGLVHTLAPRSSLVEFKRHMQCAVKDPNLNYNNGMISRMRLTPLTSKDFKAFCSYIEHKCSFDWNDCLDKIEWYENGHYSRVESFNGVNPWSLAELLRVLNGTLYYDWPWGVERFNRSCPANPLFPLINATLSRISDMRDSAFFTGGADPGLQMRLHFPYFSHCTHEDYSDIIAPWFNMWIYSLADYRRARKANSDFSEESYRKLEEGYKPWEDKVPKAALFSSVMQHRVFMYDQARLHPELIDSINEYQISRACLKPWNPTSLETCEKNRSNLVWPSPEMISESLKLPPGYAAPLFNVSKLGFSHYFPGAYKYVVVPLGKQSVLSTSARIIHVMFFSGAVVLAPRTSWIFHFQAQFKPWVHYVPITFTGADLAEKVQWLRDHDDLARQIAENGRNFARSWMRLEDFYCYTANWLDVMAEISEMTDLASKTFEPHLYPKVCARHHPEDYYFPE